ncbi:MAG: putative Ig domain-containing protein [Verrucomicrobiales bacterium]|nr:putative Ig domain-containing protein [Verrucomicrobiales bacterium]
MNSDLRMCVVSSLLRRFSPRVLPLAILWLLHPTAEAPAQVSSTNIVSGTIGIPGEVDRYTFSLSARSRFYFDALTNESNVRWTLEGPTRVHVDSRPFNQSDAGSGAIVSLEPGFYRLDLDGLNASTNGYQFRFVNLESARLLTPDTVVSNTLSLGNDSHLYRFTANAGDQFSFRRLFVSTPGNIWWRLIDPYNRETFSRGFATEPPLTLGVSGEYTVLVEGYVSNQEAMRYSFLPEFLGNTPPPPLPGTPYTLNQVIAGELVNASTNSYHFTLAEETRVLVDSLTNSANVQLWMEGPSGVAVNHSTLNNSESHAGVPLLLLPAGDYHFYVRRTSAGTSPYRLRLLTESSGSTVVPGTPILGNLTPLQESRIYRFAASAGSRLFVDVSTTNNPPNATWRLYDPQNNFLEQSNLRGGDRGPLNLKLTGTYSLVVDGYYAEDGAANAFRIDLVPIQDGLETIALGDVVSDQIESPGQTKRYLFTVPTDRIIAVDSRTNSPLRVLLEGPSGRLVNNVPLASIDGFSPGHIRFAPAGDYTLTVTATGDTTGGYGFRLVDLSAAQQVGLNTPISGTLNPANEVDAFRFTTPPGTRIFFNSVNNSGMPNAYWRCVDSVGNAVFSQGLADVGPRVLTAGGTYTVVIDGYHSEATIGNYTFSLVTPQDEVHSLALNTLVQGTVTLPGQTHLYTFSLINRTSVSFDAIIPNAGVVWSLDGPSGRIINERGFASSDAAQGIPPLNLPPGAYQLQVKGMRDETGDFSFRLLDLGSAEIVPLNATIARTLDPARETDAFSFAVSAGTEAYFDLVAQTGMPNAYWRCINSRGERIFGGGIADVGPLLLTEGGVYTLLVEGHPADTASGNYSFTIWNVVDGARSLVLGSEVSGNITTPGQTQEYRFSVPASTQVYFDSLSNDSSMLWTLQGAGQQWVSRRSFISSDGSGSADPVHTLTPGEYTLTISATGDNTGAFSFRLLNLTSGSPISPGVTVGGNLSPGNRTDVYRLEVTPGDRYFFDWISKANLPNLYWRLLDPDGTKVFGNHLSDSETNRFLVGGAYTLLVEGHHLDQAAGAYQFRVVSAGNVPPTPFTGSLLALGTTVSGSLPTATSTNLYRFALSAPTRLYFDALTYSSVSWSLAGPSGLVVNNRAFWSSDSAFISDSSVMCPAGEYGLTITGLAGAYSFRVLDAATATTISRDTLVSGTLEPAGATVLRRFEAQAGDAMFMDGRPAVGFSAIPSLRILSPRGKLVLSDSISSDTDNLIAPETGTYLISIEGRPNETAASGSFSFLLHSRGDTTNTIVLGERVAGSLTTPGHRRYYQLNLSTPATVFFDSLANNDLTWSLFGPQGEIVSSRAFWSSDSVDGRSILNLLAGNHVLVVDPAAATVGEFAFRLVDSSSAQPFTTGALVNGNLEPGNSLRLYRFNATTGQRLYVDGRPTSGFSSAPYMKIYSPLGDLVMDNTQVTTDIELPPLPQTGSYLMSVEGRYSDTSTNGLFSFLIHSITDLTNTMTVGARVEGSISIPGQRHYHRFSLTQPLRVFFDTLSDSSITATLTGPTGTLFDSRQLWSTDSADGNALLELAAGEYQLVIDPNAATLGSYAFRLIDASTATPMTLGQVVNGTLAPGVSSRLYRFEAQAGARFYFDGRPTSGFSATPYCKIYSPYGNVSLDAQSITTDREFSLLETGDYVLAVEGRYSDTSAEGQYSFLLVLNPPPLSQTLFNTNIAPDLTVSGVTLTPNANLQSGQSVLVRWTTRNEGAAATGSSFTEQVTVRNTGTSQVLVSRTLAYDDATSGPIEPAQSRARSLSIQLPDGSGSAGALQVTVTTDTLNNLTEQNGSSTAEANNSASINTTASLAPYPDLQTIQLSAEPLSGWTNGQTITLRWITTNSGNRATLGSWSESVRIRNTNTSSIILSTSLPYEESDPEQGPIAPASSRTRSLQFTVPADSTAFGAFEITVSADETDELFEYNPAGTGEQNNSQRLVTLSAPDLRVAGLAITASPALQAGAELVIQWNTTNQGNTLASGAFYDRVLVRNTNTAEVLLNTLLPYTPTLVGNGPLPAGAARARQQSLRLPDGARGIGGLEITISTDALNQLVEHNPAGTGESNNDSTVRISIADRPYPDLVITSVTAPAQAQSGQQVPVVWTVRNNGTTPATNGWADQLFLSQDPTPGSDTFLASVSFAGILNAGQSLTRTQQVSLPAFGAGARYFVVETDAANRVFEENETNNVGVSSQPTSVPTILTLQLSSTRVSENAGSQAVQATVVRNSDTTAALTVALGNSQPSRAIIPGSLTLPIGAASGTFWIEIRDDAVALGDVTITLTAQAPGHVTVTNQLVVLDNDSPALALRLSATTISEAASPGALTGQLSRNAQTNLPLTVSLTSDRPGAIAVPASVTFLPGQTNTSFNLTLTDDDVVTGNRVASIFASATGFSPVSTSITLLENDTVALTLQLSDSSVGEATLNPAAIATLTRSPISSATLRVLLSTNGGNLVQLPSEVTIPANQPGVAFPVNVRNDTLAYGAQTVNLVAQAIGSDGSPIPGATASSVLTVREDDGPTLNIAFQSAVIEEGASTLAIVSRNTPPTNSLTVSINATPAGQATAPATVLLPVGVTATNITVRGVSDGVSDGIKEVVFTALAVGYNPGTAPLTVTDIDVPDLAVVEVTVPPSSLTDGLISAIWSVTNSGLATAVGTWVDEVYLSTDAQGANASLITAVTNQGPLLVGEGYSRSRSFLLPSDPGTYWVLVRTDATRTLTEGSDRNNVLVSGPIAVRPSYRATVSTDIDSAISGTPIPLQGRTFLSTDGSPASFRTATVRINVNQVRRVLQVVSDAQGNFSTTFQPIPGEAGVYTIGADHPRVREDEAQDQFTLLGMAAVPWQVSLRLAPNELASGSIEVRNLSPLPLTGIEVAGEGVPLGFELAAAMTNSLAGNQVATLNFSLLTTLTSGASGRIALVVTSAEGAILRIPIDFVIAPPTAELVAEPASLQRGMLRGTQTLVQFDVINRGGVASGELSVALPVTPWLSLVSPSPLPSIPPAGRTTIVLALNPATNLPLTVYSGSLSVIGQEQASVSVPFTFRALSEARGDLVLTATDEYTYFVSGAPKLTNATLVLRDPFTNGIVAQARTDSAGQVRFNNLLEGDYLLEASAPGHGSTRGGIRVVPGITKEQEVFLTQETVRYEWSVVPTQIEDHYRVVLQPQFETEVPQPNLVVENPQIMPLVTPGRVSQFEIRLRNTGRIALQRVRIPVPSHPKLIITPLVTEIEELPALTSISVPVTIQVADAPPPGTVGLQGAVGLAGPETCEGTECVIHMPIDTSFKCGENFVFKEADVTLQVICVPETGCQFPNADITRIDFMTASRLAAEAELDCLLGKMNECQKARVRGYLRSGDFGSVDGPFGFGISDFCGCAPPERIPQMFNVASNYLSSLGFSPVGSAPGFVNFGTVTLVSEVPCNQPFPVPPALAGPELQGLGGTLPPPAAVCAKVRMELSQDITLTRSAFRGTLVLENNSGGSLTDIQLTVDFRDGNNQSAASLFAVRGPTLSGLSAVDGSGTLANTATGSAEYLFIPTLDAAPTQPTGYYIGGTLRFKENGQTVTIQLLPGAITVLPEARLTLEYFQQRDVYSDDPFTLEIEPSEPFVLGLRARNGGAGTARNFRIASAQPRIIENEKGLDIDFKLIGARLDNQPVDPSFTLNLGTIDPGASKTVLWDMASNLQGKFIDYRASFEHVDALGGKNLSLIEAVTVHELIHLVQDDRVGSDSLPDFLVNDSPDQQSLPDVIYLSTGLNEPVTLASNPRVDSPATTNDLVVQLTTTMSPGWSYLRLPNPGADFRLVSATRADGKTLRLGPNIWTTDRSFPSAQTGAVREQLLHLLDHNSSGSYTLRFAPTVADTNAPASAVAALPASSPSRFAVEWSGSDGAGESGIAFFDIFVSINGSPYTNWLARTTLRSALFDGINGSRYSFYSRATDLDGNVEIVPTLPDAQTTANSANTPPTLIPLADVTIDEGTQLNLRANAIDIDLPRQTISYALISAPAGATIDSASGNIRWQTGEAQGGSVARFILTATDNGEPSLIATQSVQVTVRELNSAPSFVSASTEILADEGIALAERILASDNDLPEQTLTWELAAGAPQGLSLDPALGILRWTPSEDQGPGDYPITVTVRDNGSPRQAASRTLRLRVREVNQAPSLNAIPLQAALVQTTLVVTNSATDPDRPAQEFFFSLGAGAPRGARIDRNTGVFTWTPSAEYARSTNQVTIQVTDNGAPSLTASQPLRIIVGDYLEARLGHGIALAGQSASVPIVIFTTIPATNVSFTVQVPEGRLTGFTLPTAASPLASARIQALGGNRYQVQLGTLPGVSLSGERIVSQLTFQTVANQSSAFVPLFISNVAAIQSNGSPLPRALGQPGRVVYLGREPLLEMVESAQQVDLTIYGSGDTYNIESTPSLAPGFQWTPFWSGVLIDYMDVIPVDPTEESQFFRAIQN